METLTRKAQVQEVELERTNKQLKEAIAIAGEETAKCKAAKEVIKSLTAQVFLNFLLISSYCVLDSWPKLISHSFDITTEYGVLLYNVVHMCYEFDIWFTKICDS